MIFSFRILAGLVAIGVLVARDEIVTALAIVAISSMIEALESERRRRVIKSTSPHDERK